MRKSQLQPAPLFTWIVGKYIGKWRQYRETGRILEVGKNL